MQRTSDVVIRHLKPCSCSFVKSIGNWLRLLKGNASATNPPTRHAEGPFWGTFWRLMCAGALNTSDTPSPAAKQNSRPRAPAKVDPATAPSTSEHRKLERLERQQGSIREHTNSTPRPPKCTKTLKTWAPAKLAIAWPPLPLPSLPSPTTVSM